MVNSTLSHCSVQNVQDNGYFKHQDDRVNHFINDILAKNIPLTDLTLAFLSGRLRHRGLATNKLAPRERETQ
jgi:hypothetical protein